MSQKRKHTEISEGDATRSGPKKQRSFKPGSSNPDKKRRRPQVSQDIEKGTSTNALKSRIRDLKRLLAHVDNVGDHKMSASTRIERERELEACEHELAEKVESNREAAYKQKMISKYHQVRFFDRQKASRILKKLKKEHDSEEDSVRKHELRMRVHNAEVDFNYAIHYPLMKPYSSLYPKSKKAKSEDVQQDEDDQSKDGSNDRDTGAKGDVEMWRAVEKAMEEGTLNALRYRKDDMPAAPVKKDKKNKQTKGTEHQERPRVVEGNNRRERRAHLAQQEEEDSDGGFFE